MNAEKKIVPNINVGDRVQAHYQGCNAPKMTGIVIRNDETCCIIRRDDVPEVRQYHNTGGRLCTVKSNVVPQCIYIFGDNENLHTFGRTYTAKVRKIA